MDPQLGVAGDEAPAIGESVVGAQLRAVRLAVLTVGDHDRERRRRVGLLQAAEPVVAVVERCHGEGEGAPLVAVAHLVGELFFGVEGWTAGEEVGRLSRCKQLPVDSRRRPERSGDGRPQRAELADRPIHAAARLDLDTGIVVVLDLGAERQVKVRGERDLVLSKSREPLPRDMGRQECQSGAVGHTIVDQAVAQSPDHVM